jgi:hypothetical protein
MEDFLRGVFAFVGTLATFSIADRNTPLAIGLIVIVAIVCECDNICKLQDLQEQCSREELDP